ncbi:AsmA family protein [Leptospira jelokensis]|uniref:AsmA family protein n=1 Tax=Leptospira jelokensis TaxID=2484931 RepID=A0A4Z1A5I0_9LEPT|nr:AsmA family protein [Leptospira jelokensis]TGL73975.1 AsmA family protein [Leptospira jelokensis]
MKKIGYGIGAFFGAILLIIIIAFVLAGSIITPSFLVKQIESSLNVRAHVEKVNINLFNVLSGIEIEGIILAPRDEVANKGTPLDERKSKPKGTIQLGKVDVKISFLALLTKTVKVNKLVLKQPEISLTMNEDGGNNLTSLFKTPKIVDGEKNPALSPEALAEKKAAEEEEAKEKASAPPSGPFSIKDVPIAIKMGLVGIQEGNIQVNMRKTGQQILVQKLDLEITDIDIDGSDLASHNSLDVNFDADVTIIGRNKKEAAKFLLETGGKVTPFVVKTGLVNPKVMYEVTMKEDSFLSGFAAFDAIAGELPAMNQAGLKLDKLKEKAELKKDVSFKVEYSNGKVTFLDEPTFPTKNYDLQITKGSYIVTTTNYHEMRMGMLYDEDESKKSLASVDEKIKQATKGQGDPKALRNKIVGNLVKDDRLFIPFRTYGDIRNPNVELGVGLGTLTDLIGGAVKEVIKGKAGDALKKIPGAGDALKGLGF